MNEFKYKRIHQTQYLNMKANKNQLYASVDHACTHAYTS